MQEIKTEKELMLKYNCLCKKHLRAGSTLYQLTNDELLVYIAGKTYRYGRSLDDSMKNANSHLKDRSKAIKIFSRKKTDDSLGFINK